MAPSERGTGQFHVAGVRRPNTRMPNAIFQPASATPRNDRKKKGLAISRNNQAAMYATPTMTDEASNSGSKDIPENRSKRIANKNVATTTVSNTRNSNLQGRGDFAVAALMLSNTIPEEQNGGKLARPNLCTGRFGWHLASLAHQQSTINNQPPPMATARR